MSILQEPMGIECYHVVAELERFTIFEIVVSQERLPHFQDMLIRLWKLFGPFSLWHKDLVRATNIVQSLLQAQTALLSFWRINVSICVYFKTLPRHSL